MVFNGLVVTDIRQYSVEQERFTSLVNRNQHAALQHQLKQSDGFQGDTFSAGIRA